MKKIASVLLVLVTMSAGCRDAEINVDTSVERKPNIVIIYADDVGYGDLSSYGAELVTTPNLDRLAAEGLRFTDAYATAATCTPSRYSLLTGEYAFRNELAEILPGDAPLLIEPGRDTLPSMLRTSGYRTAVVGKWHLGLGAGDVDWNGEVSPGPLEIGFDEAFLLPATNDRVPCVFIEGHRVVDLDPSDPIQVSYLADFGSLPTGTDHPELLRYAGNPEHSNTIINGISRIGFMAGGRNAWWVDEDMSDRFVDRSIEFMKENREQPFFLFLSLADVHVPRLPHARFAGKSALGRRGDALVEMDWVVGAITETLGELGLRDDTLVIFTSDNGPVVDDGYDDGALEALGDHDPSGRYRGGKYQAWEGGTRMPFIVNWPGRVAANVSSAMLSQIDLAASLVALVGGSVPMGAAPDSKNLLPVLLGESERGRDALLQQGVDTISIRKGEWKYMDAGERIDWARRKHDRPGDTTNSSPMPEVAQLYNLAEDPGETTNVIDVHPEVAHELAELLRDTLGTR